MPDGVQLNIIPPYITPKAERVSTSSVTVTKTHAIPQGGASNLPELRKMRDLPPAVFSPSKRIPEKFFGKNKRVGARKVRRPPREERPTAGSL